MKTNKKIVIGEPIFKIVLKRNNRYWSLFNPQFEYKFGIVCDEPGRIWCYRSLRRTMKSFSHYLEMYNVSPKDVVILKGLASWSEAKRPIGMIKPRYYIFGEEISPFELFKEMK